MRVDVPAVLDALGIEYRDRGGGDLWACCPHPGHEEADASWHIDLQTGIQHCFGCGQEGDAVDLAASVIGCTIGGALDWMRTHGFDRDGTANLNVVVVVNRPSRVFTLPPGLGGGELESWPTPIRRYAIKRGITPWQVRKWRLLYATDGRLAGRIVFPVYDRNGTAIGYTSRTFIDDPVRYKNAKATENASPGAIFGEEFWRTEELTLTEGAINALAFERIGVPDIGALGGSEASAEQLMKLSRFKRIVIATDSDAAGEKIEAQLRGALGRWCSLGRANFPPKKDAQALSVSELRQVWNEARHGDWPTFQSRS